MSSFKSRQLLDLHLSHNANVTNSITHMMQMSRTLSLTQSKHSQLYLPHNANIIMQISPTLGLGSLISYKYHQFYLPHNANVTNSISRMMQMPPTLIERNPPPRGVFLFTMFPHQEPGDRDSPSKHLVRILRGESSRSRFLIREHRKLETLAGGGGLSINSITHVMQMSPTPSLT